MLRGKSVLRVPLWLAALLVPLAAGSLTLCKLEEPSPEVQNLRAFAKMYGYVRFFHPSDEASAIDWDRFAVYGARRVRDAGSSQELQASLEQLFAPLGPTLQVYPSREPPTPLSALPDDTAGLRLVAWQHFGVGLSGQGSIYNSKRTGRVTRAAGPAFGTLVQVLPADAYRGKRIKLASYVRAQVGGSGNQGQMWLRVDRPGGTGFFDNMDDRPIRSSEWRRYEIEGDVAEDAARIVFGCFLLGEGRLWVDDFELLVADDDGAWQPIEITNPGFERGEAGQVPPGWGAASPGYRFALTDERPRSGELSVTIEDAPTMLSANLFEAHPAFGEVIEREIGAGLSARIPLALYGDDSATYPRADEGALARLRAGLDSVAIDSLTADDLDLRLADVVIAWNVFQHFYPYFDVVDTDWDAQFTHSLQRALADRTGEQFYYTLRELVANLRDGHGNVYHPDYQPQGMLPFLVDWIEDQVVVTFSDDSSVERGDIIERIDGVPARQAVIESEPYISGSPQWKRWRAMRAFGAGEPGDTVQLVIRRADLELRVDVQRRAMERLPGEARPGKIAMLEEGIYYVDLTEASMPEIDARMDELATAPGVIFDLRGYPNGNHAVIAHLLDAPDTSNAWMRVPQIIYPDHVPPSGYRESGWSIQPLEPHIDAKVVFITDGRAISYAESFMGFIEGYKLAQIVGQPTAGTNGNVNPMTLPGGFRIGWTGMKVLKHDGSQHHLIGVQPTLPVQRTIQGVREGRDELLEKALELVRQG